MKHPISNRIDTATAAGQQCDTQKDEGALRSNNTWIYRSFGSSVMSPYIHMPTWLVLASSWQALYSVRSFCLHMRDPTSTHVTLGATQIAWYTQHVAAFIGNTQNTRHHVDGAAAKETPINGQPCQDDRWMCTCCVSAQHQRNGTRFARRHSVSPRPQPQNTTRRYLHRAHNIYERATDYA